MEKCCGGCFGDWFLTDHINNKSNEVGTCEFCGSKNVKIISPQELLFHFDSLFELYEESVEPKAASLESLLRQDWGLFEGLERVKAESLLVHIFDNTDFFRCKFLPSPDSETTAILQWETFREELKHQRRFFPTNNSEILNLKTSFVALESKEAPTVYRARACEQSIPIPIGNMGKPPENLVGNGRANPVGIPCLYVASDADTAVAEIRPHKGEIVCVAEFRVESELSFVDLRNPRSKISPFSLDEEELKMVHRNMGYLCRLGDELAMPILPRTAHLDYLPSQYLCEFIKSCDYDGVVYKSAMGEGINYAIFNDSEVSGIDVRMYQVENVYVESSPF